MDVEPSLPAPSIRSSEPMQNETPQFALARARRALQESDLPADSHLHRAPSTRNEVFLSTQHVVRINRHPNNRLRREAMLLRSLPDYPWKPDVVSAGGQFGSDYLIVARKPGSPLSRWWPDLTMDQRYDAITQLVAAMKVIHSTQAPRSIPPVENCPQLLDTRLLAPTTPMMVALNELSELPDIDNGVIEAARILTKRGARALAGLELRYLIHGDLTFENVLWDGNEISGIIDFEWCRPGPLDLELDVLLRFCAFPFAHVAPDYENRTAARDYAMIPAWISELAPQLFSTPNLADRLVLYALSYDISELQDDPPRRPASDLGPLHPYNRLRALVSGQSYLHRILDSLSIPIG